MSRASTPEKRTKALQVEVDPEGGSIVQIVATGFSSWAEVEELISDLAMTELPTESAILISETEACRSAPGE